MAKMTLKGAAKHSVKGWGAVLTGGILLAVLALVDLPARRRDHGERHR